MGQPTGNPPPLLQYRTWIDASGFHARLRLPLPPGALAYGCVQELQARTALELTQEAVRNRVRVWVWETRQPLRVSGDPFCLDCGHEVTRGLSGDWESQESGTVCPKGGKHRVEQIVPDPPTGRAAA